MEKYIIYTWIMIQEKKTHTGKSAKNEDLLVA